MLQYPFHVNDVLPPVLALGPVVGVEDAHLPYLLVEGEGGLVMGLYQGELSIIVYITKNKNEQSCSHLSEVQIYCCYKLEIFRKRQQNEFCNVRFVISLIKFVKEIKSLF